jgi:hypothetical protein
MGRELARSDFEPSTAGIQHRIPALLELENEEDPAKKKYLASELDTRCESRWSPARDAAFAVVRR